MMNYYLTMKMDGSGLAEEIKNVKNNKTGFKKGLEALDND